LQALAGETRRTIDMSRALDAGPLPSVTRGLPETVAITPTPPDPAPLIERSQWVFDLRWERGDVWLLGVHQLDRQAAQATARAMGRFALELFEGRALIERVRFDFPLLGAAELDASISLTRNLRTRIGVVFPATSRGRRLELVDRATNHRWLLPWPPQPESPQADASGE
jgi:hypothetical protein